MLKSSLCNYSDAFILFKGKITIAAAEADVDGRQVNERNKVATYKKCEPFTNCISSKKNTQVNNAKYLDGVMPMYNLIEYSDNYSKTSGSLWQYYRDELYNTLTYFESFKTKIKITEIPLLVVIQKMLK